MLVTRCPACSTAFKVVRDQLKLSHGWVRCGRCAHVFDASLYFFEASLPARDKAHVPTARPQATPGFDPGVAAPPPSATPTDRPSGVAALTAQASDSHGIHADPGDEPAEPASVPTSTSAAAEQRRLPPAIAIETGADVPPSISAPPALSQREAEQPQARSMVDVLAELPGVAPLRRDASLAPQDVHGQTPTQASAQAVAVSDAPPAAQRGVMSADQEPLELISRFPEEEGAHPHWGGASPTVPSVDIDVLGSVRTPGANARRTVSAGAPLPKQRSPAARAAATDDPPMAAAKRPPLRSEEPRFLIEARRRALWASWPMRMLLSLLLLLGLAVGLAQFAYWFRYDLLRTSPSLRPALEELCVHLQCSIDAVERIESIVIESSSMNVAGERAVELNAVLRSRERVDNRWPQLELSLTDSRDQLIARRVLAPAEYLLSYEGHARKDEPDAAMRPLTEYPIKLTLEIDAAPPAGYRLAVFYR